MIGARTPVRRDAEPTRGAYRRHINYAAHKSIKTNEAYNVRIHIPIEDYYCTLSNLGDLESTR